MARKPYQLAATFAHIASLGFGLSFCILIALNSMGGLHAGLGTGIGLGIGLGSIAGILLGLWVSVFGAIARPKNPTVNPLGPRAVWRWDRRRGWFIGGYVGVGVGLGLWAALTLVGLAPQSVPAGVGAGMSTGLLYGLIYPVTWSAALAFLQLRIRYGTPVHLLRFLEDARERDVLRMVGPVYQFRHARLQDRLADGAGQAKSSLGQRAVRPVRS